MAVERPDPFLRPGWAANLRVIRLRTMSSGPLRYEFTELGQVSGPPRSRYGVRRSIATLPDT